MALELLGGRDLSGSLGDSCTGVYPVDWSFCCVVLFDFLVMSRRCNCDSSTHVPEGSVPIFVHLPCRAAPSAE